MVFFLTGAVNSGKTTLLKRVVDQLKKRNLHLEGYLSEALWEREGKIGYNLYDLRRERSIPFIRREGRKDWERVGPFFLIPESLARAKELILRGAGADVLVVDEVGPLEISGRGVWPALEQCVFEREQKFLLVVRKSILESAARIMRQKEIKIFNMEDGDIYSRLVEEIEK